jgi:hypothetical protein
MKNSKLSSYTKDRQYLESTDLNKISDAELLKKYGKKVKKIEEKEVSSYVNNKQKPHLKKDKQIQEYKVNTLNNIWSKDRFPRLNIVKMLGILSDKGYSEGESKEIINAIISRKDMSVEEKENLLRNVKSAEDKSLVADGIVALIENNFTMSEIMYLQKKILKTFNNDGEIFKIVANNYNTSKELNINEAIHKLVFSDKDYSRAECKDIINKIIDIDKILKKRTNRIWNCHVYTPYLKERVLRHSLINYFF